MNIKRNNEFTLVKGPNKDKKIQIRDVFVRQNALTNEFETIVVIADEQGDKATLKLDEFLSNVA